MQYHVCPRSRRACRNVRVGGRCEKLCFARRRTPRGDDGAAAARTNPPAAAADEDAAPSEADLVGAVGALPSQENGRVPRLGRDEGGGQGQAHDPVQDGARPAAPARATSALRLRACINACAGRRATSRAPRRRDKARRRARGRPRPISNPHARSRPAGRSEPRRGDLTEMANVFMPRAGAPPAKSDARPPPKTAAAGPRATPHPSRARGAAETRARVRGAHSSKPDTALRRRARRARTPRSRRRHQPSGPRAAGGRRSRHAPFAAADKPENAEPPHRGTKRKAADSSSSSSSDSDSDGDSVVPRPPPTI